MSGTDFRSTPLELREKLSFSEEDTKKTVIDICREKNIEGCVLLSTCNRTELYLSCGDEFEDPTELLLKRCGADRGAYEGRMRTRYGIDAARHLSEVACGLHSAIAGDEQIAAQIGRAAELSREADCMDAVLNNLFRNAVASGKRAITSCRITAVPRSAAYRAVDMADECLGGLTGKKALVIGSGKMGCLAARLLSERGAEVKITIRSFRPGDNLIPTGASPVEYSARLGYVSDSDVVISATRSPHFTIIRDEIKQLKRLPKYIFDLAVPRDIEPGVDEYTKCFDIDDIYTERTGSSPELTAAYSIAERSAEELIEWDRFRTLLPMIDEIKKAAADRIAASEKYAVTDEEHERTARAAAEKTTELIFKAIRESVGEEMLGKCLDRIRNGSRRTDDTGRISE